MFQHLYFLLLLILTLMPSVAFGLASANDLDLEGATITDFAQEGSLLFATADSPRGVYVSSDFGDSWVFAEGGDYSTGRGRAVAVSSGKVFAILNGRLFSSELSTPLSWMEVEIGLAPAVDDEGNRELLDEEELFSMASDGSFVFVASNHGKVRVVNADTLAVLDTGTPEILTDPRALGSFAVDRSTGFVWVLVGEVGQFGGKLYRASYDVSNGALGSFSIVTPTTLASNSSRMGGVFADGSGVLYVTTFGAGEEDEGIYRSVDNGDSYVRNNSFPVDSAGLNIRDAAFAGSTHLIGRFISFDSGANFETGTVGETGQGDIQNQQALLIDSGNSSRAIASADLGPIATSNLEQGASSSWVQKFSGLRGIGVNDMDQSRRNSQVVVLALNGGIARTTNFSDDPQVLAAQPIDWIYPILSGDFSSLVFSIALDPEDDNILYAGSSSLHRGVVDSEGNFTFIDLLNENTPARNVVGLSIAGSKILVATAQVSGALDGNVRVVNRNTLDVESVRLEGLPVSAVYAISESVMYAGVGGIPSLEVGADDPANLGLYRSVDGGVSWEQISKNDDLVRSGVSALEYDASKDILYVAALDPDTVEGDDEGDGEDDDPVSNLFIVRKASSQTVKIQTPEAGLPSGEISALAFASKDGTRRIYAAVAGDIFVSDSNGSTWALFYDGVPEEDIGVLFFDELVRGSNIGFDGLKGLPNLVVSGVSGQIKGGSSQKIKVKFNRPVNVGRDTKRKIRAKARRRRTRTRISSNGLRASIAPRRGGWPKSGKIRVRIGSTVLTADGDETIDSDYDGAQGGSSYRKAVRIR